MNRVEVTELRTFFKLKKKKNIFLLAHRNLYNFRSIIKFYKKIFKVFTKIQHISENVSRILLAKMLNPGRE